MKNTTELHAEVVELNAKADEDEHRGWETKQDYWQEVPGKYSNILYFVFMPEGMTRKDLEKLSQADPPANLLRRCP